MNRLIRILVLPLVMLALPGMSELPAGAASNAPSGIADYAATEGGEVFICDQSFANDACLVFTDHHEAGLDCSAPGRRASSFVALGTAVFDDDDGAVIYTFTDCANDVYNGDFAVKGGRVISFNPDEIVLLCIDTNLDRRIDICAGARYNVN